MANGVSKSANGVCRATGGAYKPANGLSQSGEGVCRPAFGRRQRAGAARTMLKMVLAGSGRIGREAAFEAG